MIARFKGGRDEKYRKFLDICAVFEADIAKETAIGRFTYGSGRLNPPRAYRRVPRLPPRHAPA